MSISFLDSWYNHYIELNNGPTALEASTKPRVLVLPLTCCLTLCNLILIYGWFHIYKDVANFAYCLQFKKEVLMTTRVQNLLL